MSLIPRHLYGLADDQVDDEDPPEHAPMTRVRVSQPHYPDHERERLIGLMTDAEILLFAGVGGAHLLDRKQRRRLQTLMDGAEERDRTSIRLAMIRKALAA